MAVSKLAKITVPAHSSNYSKGRGGYRICKFTPHHMAGILTAKRCGELFQNPNRNASANYCIGNDGTIASCVDENDRAWTSSSKINDCQAITVEVSNSSTGGKWPISDAAWKSLIELAVDVCTRYNFRLTYDGTPNGSLTSHNMFVPTTCPGPYLESKFNELVHIVNSRLDEAVNEYLVKVTSNNLNIRSNAGTNSPVVGKITNKGVYTIVAEKNAIGADRWGKLKSGAGWISLDYTEKVHTPVIETGPRIEKGSKVKFVGTHDYNGERLSSWVTGSIFDVISVFDNRVVIGKGRLITAAVKKSDLVLI